MAKLTYLDLANRVLKRITQPEVATMKNAVGTSKIVGELINEAQNELWTETTNWYSLFAERNFQTQTETSTALRFVNSTPAVIQETPVVLPKYEKGTSLRIVGSTGNDGIYIVDSHMTDITTITKSGTLTGFSVPTAVAWNGSFYCLIGMDYTLQNIAVTSVDGVTWSAPSLIGTGAGSAYYAMTWNGRFFCAIGANTQSAISVDGITWTLATLPLSGYNWFDIVWNGKIFCAVGGSAYALTSPDGLHWSTSTMPVNSSWSQLAWNGSVFVAVSSSSADSSGGIAAISPDGFGWTRSYLPVVNYWRCIAWNGTVFCALSAGLLPALGGSNVGAISSDGITWQQVTLPQTNLWSRITANDYGMFFAVSTWSAVYTTGAFIASSDGINWKSFPIINPLPVYKIATNGVDFIIATGETVGSPFSYRTSSVAEITFQPSDRFVTEAPGSTVSLYTLTYPVASDFGRAYHLVDLTNNRIITEDTTRGFSEDDPQMLSFNQPTHFSMQGNFYRLYYPPSGVYTIIDRYWKSPQTLVNDADLYDFPLFCENFLIHYAWMKMLEYLNKFDQADRIRLQIYGDPLKKMPGIMQKCISANRVVIDKMLRFHPSRGGRAIEPPRFPSHYGARYF